MKELFVKWKVEKEGWGTVVKLLPSLIHQTRAEPGNLLYNVYCSEDDPSVIILHEQYKDKNALEAHKNSNHYKEMVLDKIVPLLTDREVTLIEKFQPDL